jgi:23S rRNA (adenine2503-C2)-methyltransferase
MSKKNDIRSFSLDQIKTFLTENKEASFRATQIWEWLWKKGVASFTEMNNLSLTLREKLDRHFFINTLKLF